MSSSAKRKPVVGCPSSRKNWKNKFFFAGGNWCLVIYSLGGDIHLPMRFVTPGHLFFFMLLVPGRYLFISLTLSMFSDSWGLISKLNEDPLLKVETALVNASHCQDLLSPTNLLGSGLVDVVVGMDNKIFSVMSRKCAWGSGDSSSAPAPQKKSNINTFKAPIHALPPHPPRKNGEEKLRDKRPGVSTQFGDRASPLPPRDQGDYLTPYQKDYAKSVGPKMVKDIQSMSLGELAGFVQRVSFKLATLVSYYKNRSMRHERKLQAKNQDLKKKAESADRSKEKMLDLHSERDTLRTTYEEQVKSLNKQIAELKGKSTEVDDRLDAEYHSGIAFCYKCIIFLLKEEYPELNMSKLEICVQKYTAEQG
ncbi:uncharacterized protein LOC107176118 [Citrus sinensis]|uniref:uncharacterized protein LOC107176118 n=1 Tax=Citrus sinensis TaxID=2711 RepID=UPI002277792C|nr:uncharacterized protein LOC107176118 [Citrus sinensis]